MASVRFFWRCVTYRKGLLMTLLGCALVTAAVELIIPWLLWQAIDTRMVCEVSYDLRRRLYV